MTQNFSHFEEYFSHFDGLLSFQFFQDREQCNVRPHVVHTSNPRHIQSELIRINRAGAGVYLTVNETNGSSRKASDIVRVRALFADLDTVKPDNIDSNDWNPLAVALQLCDGLDPHIIVESSPGKYHLYWMVRDFPIDQFKLMQKGIIQKFNERTMDYSSLMDHQIPWFKSMEGLKLADEVIHDLPRVLRPAGFYHNKGALYPVKLWNEYSSHHPAYTIDEVQESFKPYEPPKRHIEPSDQKATLAQKAVFGDFDFKHFDIVALATASGMSPRHYDGERYHVDCPWSAEHTKTGKTDTVIWAKPQWPQFSCSHNSCRDRDVKQLAVMMEWVKK